MTTKRQELLKEIEKIDFLSLRTNKIDHSLSYLKMQHKAILHVYNNLDKANVKDFYFNIFRFDKINVFSLFKGGTCGEAIKKVESYINK